MDSSAAAIQVIAFIVLAVIMAMTVWSLVRLLRRTGHSGWWVVLLFVPLVNYIALWIWAFTPNGKRPTDA